MLYTLGMYLHTAKSVSQYWYCSTDSYMYQSTVGMSSTSSSTSSTAVCYWRDTSRVDACERTGSFAGILCLCSAYFTHMFLYGCIYVYIYEHVCTYMLSGMVVYGSRMQRSAVIWAALLLHCMVFYRHVELYHDIEPPHFYTRPTGYAQTVTINHLWPRYRYVYLKFTGSS